MRAHSELQPDDITAIVDTREQLPLSLAPLRQREGTLGTGDYSVAGLEEAICVERKSLPDLLACCGRERDRFERELERMMAYPNRLLVIEAGWGEIQLGQWRSHVTPSVVIGSLLGWMAQGIPVLLAGSHEGCAQMVGRFLFISARRRWREVQAFLPELKLAATAAEKTA